MLVGAGVRVGMVVGLGVIVGVGVRVGGETMARSMRACDVGVSVPDSNVGVDNEGVPLGVATATSASGEQLESKIPRPISMMPAPMNLTARRTTFFRGESCKSVVIAFGYYRVES